VRLGKVQCATARSLCEIRPKPITESGFKQTFQHEIKNIKRDLLLDGKTIKKWVAFYQGMLDWDVLRKKIGTYFSEEKRKKEKAYIVGIAFTPNSAIASGTSFANASACAHCSSISTNRKVRLGEVQCAPAQSLCENRPEPAAIFGLKQIKTNCFSKFLVCFFYFEAESMSELFKMISLKKKGRDEKLGIVFFTPLYEVLKNGNEIFYSELDFFPKGKYSLVLHE
jgi:hypothetical protein